MFDCRYSIVISVTLLLLLVVIRIDGFSIQQFTKIKHHKLRVSPLSSSSTAIEVDSSKYLDEKQVCGYYIIFFIFFVCVYDTYYIS